MTNDLTFFTNDPSSTLLERFKSVLRFTQHFDVLVGYFRASGFYLMQDALEGVEHIRILVGLNVDTRVYSIVEKFRGQGALDFESHTRMQEVYAGNLAFEMEHSEDRAEVEGGIRKLLEFMLSGKLEIKAHPSQNIHAKVYICRHHPEQSSDFGKVITGSSNFSQSGLQDQYEFNVELKTRADVNYALEHFERLWAEAVDLNETFVETLQQNTWLNDTLTPYELYIKFLYEYFKEDMNIDQEYDVYLPQGFKELAYQKQAVISAKKILDAYGGVFLADVVGLGKTFIAALLAQQLPGRKLVICPPVLVDYWKETFFQFGIVAHVESLGKLDHILPSSLDRFDYVFVDEAHRFRNELTKSYEMLYRICRRKKVILVSATPLNNTIRDIYSQIKLFQNPRQSLIPGLPNLEKFFDEHIHSLEKIKREDPDAYVQAVRDVAQKVRERVLKYVMVRRTRSEIVNYFSTDMNAQGIAFPTINDPHKIPYLFDAVTDQVFCQTIEKLSKFTYSRYMPLLYSICPLSPLEEQSQRNIGGFMKSVLVKRLESSFYAFQRTLGRFIQSYHHFIQMYHNGKIYISDNVNVQDYLETDNEEELLNLVSAGQVKVYPSAEFKPEFIQDLQKDLAILQEVQQAWQQVTNDPKLTTFIAELKTNSVLKGKRCIVFTESAATGDYLYRELNAAFSGRVLFYSSKGGIWQGNSINGQIARDLIRQNYDPAHHDPADSVQILITTDVLAEGINLHRSNIVINYDLPWNPTRVLQRVGRVNRVGTEHTQIEIFNFFPTSQADEHLGLQGNIKAKLRAFQTLLGEDARYLTNEEEIGSFELFGETLYQKLNSRSSYEDGEEEGRSELEFLLTLRTVRDENPDLLNRIRNLPKKARCGRAFPVYPRGALLTFFRRGRLKKFLLAQPGQSEPRELTFLEAADVLRCAPETARLPIPPTYYDLLHANKNQLAALLDPAASEGRGTGGHTNEEYILKRIKAREFKHAGFNAEEKNYIRRLIAALEDGAIPQLTCRKVKQQLEKEPDAHRAIGIIRQEISETLLSITDQSTPSAEQREVILSAYLTQE